MKSKQVVANQQKPVSAPTQEPTQAPVVAPVQMTAEQRVALRARRVDAVVAAAYQRRVAAKQEKFLAIKQQFEDQQAILEKREILRAFMAEKAAALGIEINMDAVAPRANSATDDPSKNEVKIGDKFFKPTKAVWELARMNKGNRKATIEQAVKLGVNQNTAQTQYGFWKKAEGSKYLAS